MCIVAHTALFEPDRIVSMGLGKIITLMAVETAAFKDKTATPVQAVALCALHAWKRRMLVKSLKCCRRIRTNEEMHFLFAAFPLQSKRVQAGGHFKSGVKNIWEGLFGLDDATVQVEFPRWRRGYHINLAGFMR
jgi:hypothetical protein